MTFDIGRKQVRNGDTVHVTGTGCVDPGTGLRAAFVRLPFGNTSNAIGEDGTFAADEVVPDHQPPGEAKLMTSCWRATDSNPIVTSPPVSVTIETSYEASISSKRIAAGSEFSFAADCPGTVPYNWSQLRFTAPDQTITLPDGEVVTADGTVFSTDQLVAANGIITSPAGTVAFEINGPLGGGTVTMPTGITPGTYHATPTCEEQRGTRPTKYFQTFDVTVSG